MSSESYEWTMRDLETLRARLRQGSVPWTSSEVQNVKQSIQIAQDQLDFLPSLIDNLQEFVRLQSAFIHPLQRLPMELLGEVFWHYAFHSQDALPHLHLGQTPLILSRVSSRWRQTALTMPSLWSSFSLSCLPVIPKSSPWTLVILRAHLEYSSQNQLTIDVDLSGFNSFNVQVLSKLVKTSARWRSISFKALSPSFIPVLSHIQGNIPVLRAMHLEGDYKEFQEDYPNTAFTQAPLLTKATIRWFHPSSVNIPWSQIQELTMSSANYISLPEDVNLDHVRRLRLLADAEFQLIVDDPIRLPNFVEHLTFQAGELGVWESDTMKNFILPSTVTSLSVVNEGLHTLGRIRTLSSLFSRSFPGPSFPQIQQLHLSDIIPSSDHHVLRSLLANLPELLDLTVALSLETSTNILTSFLNARTNPLKTVLAFHRDDLRTPCPKLQKLSVVRIEGDVERVFECLEEMIRHRLATKLDICTSLESIRLEFLSQLDEYWDSEVKVVAGIPVLVSSIIQRTSEEEKNGEPGSCLIS